MLRTWAVQKHLSESYMADPEASGPSVSSWLALISCKSVTCVCDTFLICKKRPCCYTKPLPVFSVCVFLPILLFHCFGTQVEFQQT